jgi:hypothetical protein
MEACSLAFVHSSSAATASCAARAFARAGFAFAAGSTGTGEEAEVWPREARSVRQARETEDAQLFQEGLVFEQPKKEYASQTARLAW